MDLFKIVGKIAIDSADAEKALNGITKTAKGVGSVFATVGKGVLIGVGAATGGIVAIGKAAVDAYSEYEQLVGGSQLMFGKGYDFIAEKAKTAYKDVQMSQNEYLQQVNGFAVGLKTALGGNEQAAAELSHKIVVAEADIVAATGNSAEMVQNAFNGIMKSNFTMLDNLGLGITPTKEGFQEVIDKVNEWNAANGNATKYQIDNLADCQSALVDYIEMQGMSGYAANEAAGTIQGSLGMLKGSWSDLLSGLADPSADITSLINNLFESATAVANNLIEPISNILVGIAGAIEQLAPKVTEKLPGLFNQLLPPLIQGAIALVEGLVQAFPSIISALMGALPQLIDGVMQIVDALIGALPQIITTLVAALPTLIPQLIDGVVSLIMMLVEMLPQILQPIIDALPTVIVAIVEALLSNLPVLIAGCVQLIAALAAAIPQIIGALWEAIKGIFVMLGEKILGFFEPVKTAISNAWQAMGNVPGLSAMKTMIENVWGAIKSYISTAINAVKNVISTVWNSIKNVVSTVLNSIKNVITTAWNAVKTIISNVMKLISSVLKGDWEGVKNAISNILNAIKSVIKSIWDGIKNTIKSALDGIKSVVSSVWNGIKSVISSALNSVKSIVSSVWNGIKGTISGVVTGLKTTVTTGFKDIKEKVTGAFKDLPGKLKDIGKNLVEGLWKGINNAKDWVLDKIKGFGKGILNGLKSFFGIESPSTVMRDEVGRYLAEGVAVGIDEKASVAEEAAEKLGEKILQAAEKRLDEFQTYNEMTLAEEVGYWDEVRKLCAEGTDARLAADKKYLEAKKSLDDQILAAEQELQQSLDNTYKKIADRKKSILDSFDVFGNSENAEDMYMNMYANTKALETYQQQIDKLEGRIGGTAFYEAIKDEGLDAHKYVAELATMTDAQLQAYIALYDQRSQLAENLANDELGAEVLEDTALAYETFAKRCAELGVDVANDTGNIEASIVTSFTTIANKVGTAMESFSGSVASNMQTAATAVINALKSISDAMSSLVTVASPDGSASDTLTSEEDAALGATAGSGKKGIDALIEQNSTIIYYLQSLQSLIRNGFADTVDAFDVKLQLDTGAIVGELAEPMNEQLGKLSSQKERGR